MHGNCLFPLEESVQDVETLQKINIEIAASHEFDSNKVHAFQRVSSTNDDIETDFYVT